MRDEPLETKPQLYTAIADGLANDDTIELWAENESGAIWRCVG